MDLRRWSEFIFVECWGTALPFHSRLSGRPLWFIFSASPSVHGYPKHLSKIVGDGEAWSMGQFSPQILFRVSVSLYKLSIAWGREEKNKHYNSTFDSSSVETKIFIFVIKCVNTVAVFNMISLLYISVRLKGRNQCAWGLWALAAWVAPVRGRAWGAVFQSQGTCFCTFLSQSHLPCHPLFFLFCRFLPIASPSAWLLKGCQNCIPHWLLPWLIKLITAFSLAFEVRWNLAFHILLSIPPQVAEIFLCCTHVLMGSLPSHSTWLWLPCTGPLRKPAQSLSRFPRGLGPALPSRHCFPVVPLHLRLWHSWLTPPNLQAAKNQPVLFFFIPSSLQCLLHCRLSNVKRRDIFTRHKCAWCPCCPVGVWWCDPPTLEFAVSLGKRTFNTSQFESKTKQESGGKQDSSSPQLYGISRKCQLGHDHGEASFLVIISLT